jgi:hypothetical protein
MDIKSIKNKEAVSLMLCLCSSGPEYPNTQNPGTGSGELVLG